MLDPKTLNKIKNNLHKAQNSQSYEECEALITEAVVLSYGLDPKSFDINIMMGRTMPQYLNHREIQRCYYNGKARIKQHKVSHPNWWREQRGLMKS